MCTIGAVETGNNTLITFKNVDKPKGYGKRILYEKTTSQRNTYYYVPFFNSPLNTTFLNKKYSQDCSTTVVNMHGLSIFGAANNFELMPKALIHDADIWLNIYKEAMDFQTPKAAAGYLYSQLKNIQHGGGIYLVAGFENNKICKYLIETEMKNIRIKKFISPWLVSTNIPQLFNASLVMPDDYSRRTQLLNGLKNFSQKENIQTEDIQLILRSHDERGKGSQGTICRHPNKSQGHERNSNGQYKTVAGLITVSKNGRLEKIFIARGNPCKNGYSLKLFPGG